MNGSSENQPPTLTPRIGILPYSHFSSSGGTLSFARLESSQSEYRPITDRPPMVSSVYVQLKSAVSSHVEMSVYVPFAVGGIDPESHLLLGLDPEPEDEDPPEEDDEEDASSLDFLLLLLATTTPTGMKMASSTTRRIRNHQNFFFDRPPPLPPFRRRSSSSYFSPPPPPLPPRLCTRFSLPPLPSSKIAPLTFLFFLLFFRCETSVALRFLYCFFFCFWASYFSSNWALSLYVLSLASAPELSR